MDGIKHSHASEGYQDRRKLGPDYYQDSDPPLQATLRGVVLPSPEVAVFLIEIYFSRMYNACLLFHKKTFLSDYAANRIPDFVALSIFAFASMCVVYVCRRQIRRLIHFQLSAQIERSS
jgi:hypothetical protein